jgi:simple sugar transport system permease protein
VIAKIGGTGVNWGIALCLAAGLATWVFLRHTRLGYELLASGENARAARYAGMPYGGLVVLVLVLSGGLAGLGGFLEASATLNRLQPSIMVGYGYTAIVVAWLARLNPLSIGLASFLLAALRVGVENLQLDLQVPAAFGLILEGLVLLTVLAGGFFSEYGIRFRRDGA